jgi:hypothetical protein
VDRSMPRDKSVGAALVLTFFFGPFGMLYSVAWWAALLMMVGAFFAGLLTFFIFGVGAGVFWAASMVWGAVAASNKHSRYLAWLAAQPQTFLTQAPQVAADQLPSASPPPSNDKAHELEDGTVTAPLPQLSAATPAAVAQPAAGSESSPSNREEEALLGLKRLSELGLITEQEAAAKRAEILTRLFPVPPSGEATIASDHSTPDDVHLADDTAACDRTGELPTMTVAVEPSEDATEPMAAVAATTEVAGAGVAPPAASRRKWLVVGVVAALLAAVAVAGALLVLSSRHHARPTTPSPIGVLASPSPSTVPLSASRLVTVTVPVNALPTSQGIDGATQLYPATIAVRVPSR